MIPTRHHLLAVGVKDTAKWLPAIVKTCDEFEINTPERVAAFLAQTAHESGGYTVLVENLNYSADGMAAIWPKRFAVLGADGKPVKVNGKNQPNKFALALHRKPEAIANVVYSNRMGNGPIESGDGWLFRGRGLKQLTGRDNVTRCSKALGVDFVSNPDLLLEPEYAARSAGWFWQANSLAKFADSGDIKGMTLKINGGLIGLADREARYNTCHNQCTA